MRIRTSLRWQLQLYYLVLLFLTLAILTGLAIHWMRVSELYKYDSRLRDLQRFVIPMLAGPHPATTDLFLKQPESNYPPPPFGRQRQTGPPQHGKGPSPDGPTGPPPYLGGPPPGEHPHKGPSHNGQGPPPDRPTGPPPHLGGPPPGKHPHKGPPQHGQGPPPEGPMGPPPHLGGPPPGGHPHMGPHHHGQGPPPERPMGPPPHLGGPPPDSPVGPSHYVRKALQEGWYFGSWAPDGTVVAASLNFPDHAMPAIQLRVDDEAIIRDYQGYRQLVTRSLHYPSVVIAYPRAAMDAEANQRAWLIIAFSAALFLISASIGWVLIRRALRPLKAIQDTADEVASGQLGERIDASAQPANEIGELSKNLNQSFGRLETMFDRQARFTSDASHELRTPLAVILNHCQHGLEKERTGQQYRDALSACLRAGERMTNLTTDLLELSKLESGETDLKLAPCSLGDIAEEALGLVEHAATDKGVILKGEIQDVSIKANADRIWQVIVNLLNNAIRHTPTGKSVLLRTERDGSEIKISVIDQGEGIPAKAIPQLFDRFYRVDSSRTRTQQEGGFGLGLAICDTIIKAHGGSFQVESKPGVETRFVVHLPENKNSK